MSRADPLRRDALLDQISDAISDRTRLPGSRTGDDQCRFRLRRDDAKLLFVQLLLVSRQPFGQAARRRVL